jgi:hypothetical protein
MEDLHPSARGQDHLLQAIQVCTTCHRVCLETLNHALAAGGRESEPGLVARLLDCAALCQAAVDFMVRDSPLYRQVCALTAEAAELCARDLAGVGDDQVIQVCSQTCERAAASARQTAQLPL